MGGILFVFRNGRNPGYPVFFWDAVGSPHFENVVEYACLNIIKSEKGPCHSSNCQESDDRSVTAGNKEKAEKKNYYDRDPIIPLKKNILLHLFFLLKFFLNLLKQLISL